MNKKLMAVAVAGALAAPALAFAQASTVQIYGRVNVNVDQYSNTGATAPNADWKSRTRVVDNASRLGFRGEEALGGGLKAVFLMENGVAVDTGNGNGQNGANNNQVGASARAGYVGLEGSWGRLVMGKQNVWWGNGENEQWQTNYGSVANQTFTGGFGRGMGVGVSYVANVIQYTSPVMSGVNAVASYSPSAQELAAANKKADGNIMGLTVQGTHGNGIIWGWDYVKNKNNTPDLLSQGSATANKLRGGFKYQPGAQVSLIWLKIEHNNPGSISAFNSSIPVAQQCTSALNCPAAQIGSVIGAILGAGPNGALGTTNAAGPVAVTADGSTKLTQSAYGVVWEHMFGNFGVEASWSKTQDIKGCMNANGLNNCADTNATSVFLGARYLLSKRTAVLAYYLKHSNASQYNQDMPAGGQTSTQGNPPNGADPRAYGVGMIHNF